jgi:uncharacterized protein YggE
MLISIFLWLGISAAAQDIQINRQNKTIAVTADESATADAEVAVLGIGFHNYAATQDLAYKDNVKTSDSIIKALLATGIPKENLETEKLQLTHVEPDQRWSPEMKKERQFEAQQSWHVTVPVRQAQAVVDLAVNKGANEVDDVEWEVVDQLALQAKASGAALAKARTIADQMAKGLGAKLGELVYASNRAPVPKMFRYIPSVSTAMAELGTSEKQPKLTLYPQKVKSDTTVYAVFAIE